MHFLGGFCYQSHLISRPLFNRDGSMSLKHEPNFQKLIKGELALELESSDSEVQRKCGCLEPRMRTLMNTEQQSENFLRKGEEVGYLPPS